MAVSTILNFAPILISVRIAGWLGINMNLSMAIVFVIIIELTIDDTVHFISYNTALAKDLSVLESIEEALLLSENAVVITIVILDLTLYLNFGFISSLALFCAMVLDLLLLLATLIYIEKRNKR